MEATSQRKRNTKVLHDAIISQDLQRMHCLTRRHPPDFIHAIGATFGNFGFLINQSWGKNATPLHAAINIGELEISKHLIEEGVDVNCGRVEGVPPLTFALGFRHYDIVRLLLQAGADVNLFDEEGKAPMFHAIQGDTPASIVADLLTAGVPKDGIVCKVDRSRPLTRAIHMQNIPVVKYLLQKSVDVNSCTVEGTTPLNIAISHSNWEITRLLVKHGADVEGLQGRDEPPLYMIALIRPTPVDVLELLVKAGADINRMFTPSKYLTNKLPFKYGTALFVAVACNNLEAVKALLVNGADVNKRRPEQHGTALHAACLSEIKNMTKEVKNIYTKVVQVLLDNGADVNAKDKHGILPIESMCFRKNWIAIEECIRSGLSVNTTMLNGRDTMTLFHFVLNEMSHPRLVELCLDHGADRFIRCQGVLPYHFVFSIGNPATITPFLKHGHPYDDFEFPTLSFCNAQKLLSNQKKFFDGIKSNNVRDVREALADGAVARSTSMEMKHPVHFACSKGYTEIVRLLLEHGVPPSTLDCVGRCALHLAERRRDSATCTVLLRHGACYNYNHRAGAPSPVLAAVRRHFAMVRRGDGAVVEELRSTLGSEQFWAYINCVNRRGNTLVREALRLGHARIAEAIMDLRLRSS